MDCAYIIGGSFADWSIIIIILIITCCGVFTCALYYYYSYYYIGVRGVYIINIIIKLVSLRSLVRRCIIINIIITMGLVITRIGVRMSAATRII